MKINRTVIIILIILIIGYVLNGFGVFFKFNNLIPNSPDISCKSDTDCRLVNPDYKECKFCSSCKTYKIDDPDIISINKNWRPSCPFNSGLVLCPACVGRLVCEDSFTILGQCDSTTKLGTGLKCINNTLLVGEDCENEKHVKCVDNKCQKVIS